MIEGLELFLWYVYELVGAVAFDLFGIENVGGALMNSCLGDPSALLCPMGTVLLWVGIFALLYLPYWFAGRIVDKGMDVIVKELGLR